MLADTQYIHPRVFKRCMCGSGYISLFFTHILSSSHLTWLQPSSFLHGFHVPKLIGTLQALMQFSSKYIFPSASHKNQPCTGM